MPTSAAALVLALAVLLGVAWVARTAPRMQDWAFGGVLLAWLGCLSCALLLEQQALHEPAVALARLACQWLMLASAVLLCHAEPKPERRWRVCWLVFAFVGSVLALALDTPALQRTAHLLGLSGLQLWLSVNVLGALVVALLLVDVLRQRPQPTGWMALLIAITGLGMLLSDWQASQQQSWAVSGQHFLFVLALFAYWLASRFRQREPPPAGWMHRNELAQELHDGVGSQLVSILSSLDASSPAQKRTAHELQNCLIELKLLVDGMEADCSLMSHLASLRYRMDPLLAASHIRMEWLVTNEDSLNRVRGDAAKHVLRLTQEALANVIHHSKARTVTVLCRHRLDIDSLLLCVADDGRGIRPGPRAARGKGLPGMRQRAQRLGGRLSIESGAQGGTVVQLLVPMARLRAGPMPPD